ncbi:MAG: hypothetical protein PHQ59_01790 [Candidatus Daviesbacteria bacterium]|nr:hypothetical protein [Candidatus Daviesbacteria bacterium]
MADKQYGGWYDNPTTGKNQRWWGEGIWTNGEDPGQGQGQGGQGSVGNLAAGLSNLGGGSMNLMGFDLPTLQTNFQDTYGKLQGAESELQGYQTRRYEEEYSKSGLDKVKGEIDALDTSIATEKNLRDESVSKVRKNPGYSAATITGETGEIQRLANAKINNLIDERNTKAGTYNAKLGEITNKVGMETKDKESSVNSMRYNLQFLGGLLQTYQQARTQELSAATETSRWEKEFELKLYEAQTGRINASKGGSGANQQQVKDAWGNIVGYFDPATGKTTYYQSEEGAGTGAAAQTIPSEGLRMKIRDAWKQGYTADQLKGAYGTAVTDKGENVSSIIDDEWNTKTQGGIGGFLKRLFTPGV